VEFNGLAEIPKDCNFRERGRERERERARKYERAVCGG